MFKFVGAVDTEIQSNRFSKISKDPVFTAIFFVLSGIHIIICLRNINHMDGKFFMQSKDFYNYFNANACINAKV